MSQGDVLEDVNPMACKAIVKGRNCKSKRVQGFEYCIRHLPGDRLIYKCIDCNDSVSYYRYNNYKRCHRCQYEKEHREKVRAKIQKLA